MKPPAPGPARARLRGAACALLLALLALVAAACREAESFHGEVVEPPEPAPELAGTDWDGTRFRLSDQEGKVSLVFFGYTFCPDICPMTLTKMKRIEEGLGEDAEDLEVVFVSVDPHRDTVEKLASYVPNFDRSFHGVHLTFDELEQVKDDFGLTVQYSQPKDGPGSDSYYYVDHTGNYFVVDRDGNLRLKYPPTAEPEEMLADIERLLSS